MISSANYLAIFVSDKDSICINYDDFLEIAPSLLEMFDDRQFFTTELSNEEFADFCNKACQFEIWNK